MLRVHLFTKGSYGKHWKHFEEMSPGFGVARRIGMTGGNPIGRGFHRSFPDGLLVAC